ncbi:glycoside hydrolase family 2 protein [Elizabethkingia sp. JS20170427COW]|uniref:glycoside hydrolase family 2 protein n=1 Tax=Elizabethkingia sp. JS20170427COW TaxID=2583851 RepID=UPI001110A0AC|nr:glycoside hydrolase family 2 TIM barrel-domain containing protein [Elizabethkingia sp. JS20170427COW]QCX54011.1 beta-galactosidase [Elizabethkingia sp. JS20170427COW]
MLNKIQKAAVLALLFSGGIAYAQRVVSDFNQDWRFFKPLNSTYTLDFPNGQDLKLGMVDLWENVNLPHTFNKEDMQKDRNFFTGDVVYQKSFTPDARHKDKRIFLRFEGVGSVAKIYINNKYIGEHKGAYSQFAFEITNSLIPDKENVISVVANNQARKDVIPVNQFLFPIYGGIYRPVSLITTDKTQFTVTDNASPGILISQKNVSAKSADIEIKARLNTTETTIQNAVLETSILDKSGKVVASKKENVKVSPQGTTYIIQNLAIKNPHLWDGIRDPYLYKVVSQLSENGKIIDELQQKLGLRTVEIIPGKGVLLNGKKYPMYGVSRHQDEWGYGSALSYEQHQRDMEMMKEMGVTTLRLAHYQQAPQMYDLADEYGFLVWAEIPFVNAVSYQESENAKQQMVELVKQNYNHPSIFIWGVHNEVYSKTKDEQVPVLSRQLNEIAKTIDPYRFTGAVNGFSNVDRQENLSTDVQGINHYYGWYNGEIKDLEAWAENLEKNFPQYKVFLTEYGADGNMDIGSEKVEKPKNVVSGNWFPENYQTETHIQQWAIIERYPIISASYVWNMFEFAVPMWNRGGVNARNLKGLVSFDRKRKKDSFYWYKANWNPQPMIYLANRRDNIRKNSTAKIQAFSNMKNVKFIINGKEFTPKQGVNNKHWVLENAPLQKGENLIKVVAANAKEVLTDEMTWILE